MNATSAALVVPRGLSWTLIGTFVNAACQWLAIIAVTRLGTPEILGHYSYALAVCAPLVMLVRLNMRTVLATDIKARYHFDDYFVARLVLIGLGTIALMIYAATAKLDAAAIAVLAGTLAYKNVESIADVVHGLLQRDEKFAVIGRSTIFRGISLLGCLAFGLAVCNSLAIGLGLTALIWLAVFVTYDCRSARDGRSSWFNSSPARIVQLTRECLPSGLVMMVSSLSVNVPVYVVAGVLGAEQVGYYAAVAYLLTVGGLAATAVSQSSAAHMARLYFSDRRAYWQQLATFLAGSVVLSGVAVAGVLLFGRQVLVLLYGSEYAHLEGALVWIAVTAGLTFAGSFLGLSLTIARRFYHDLTFSALSGVVTAGAAWWLVPTHGVSGAAGALLAGVAVKTILSAAALVRLERHLGGSDA